MGETFRASPWRGPAPAGGWRSVFAVYAGPSGAPALLGDYRQSGGAILFTPSFPPQADLDLRAAFKPEAGPPITRVFAGGRLAVGAAPSVSAVYPAGPTWAGNTLKTYIQFSRPMATGQEADHIRLLGQDGKPVADAFVNIPQELWDPQGRRLTILFDPGRLKRGVGENMVSGEVLVPGRRFTLHIDPMRAADGAMMSAPFDQTFTAGPDVREKIDLSRWRLAPPAQPDQPLTVDFGRPLDHALILDRLQVMRDGRPVAGVIVLDDHDQVWRFRPDQPWRPGAYQLATDNELEDLAGNRPDRLFDRDATLGQGIDPRPVLKRDFSLAF
ncbi:MAG: hypothetical protein JWM33_138 [Caulobacteraceae bacterium]|nr:hypothetical protein [Caulobacteraceae bacterium]